MSATLRHAAAGDGECVWQQEDQPALHYLLDTRMVLWWLSGDAALSRTAREEIAESDNQIVVGAVRL